MNHFMTGLSALLAAGLISGCASNPVYEERYPWNAGWREGVVTSVGIQDELRRRYAQRCEAEAARSAPVRFATVRWIKMGKGTSQTVTVPIDSTLKVGDLVYVKVFDCAGQAVTRTMQQKSAAPQDQTHGKLPLETHGRPRPTGTAADHV